MRRRLLTALLALLAGAAQACGDGSLPPVAARYRVTLSVAGAGPSLDWIFVREASRVAVMRGDVDELWHCDGPAGVRLERVFHADRHVADYAAGELLALGVEADWRTLATLVDERDLALLVRDDRVPARYRGVLRGDTVELDWDPQRRLPIRLVRRDGDRTLRLERTEVHDHAPPAWPLPGQGSADYARIDAADFGDMASSPAVRRMQRRDQRTGSGTPHTH